jgi:hypothetical protein
MSKQQLLFPPIGQQFAVSMSTFQPTAVKAPLQGSIHSFEVSLGTQFLHA